MESSPSLFIYAVIDIAQGLAVLAVLAVLIWIWRKGPRWARILIVITLILALLAAVLLVLYVVALGQADWSH